MPKKRTSLDSIDLGLNPNQEEPINTPKKINKVQKACYFESETVALIETYILQQKQLGNRGISFNKCVNNGLQLFIAEQGLK